MCGDATIYPTTMNFAKVEEVVIVIIYTKFGEDLYSSLDFTGSEILHVCIDLTTSHYNIACTAVQLVMKRRSFFIDGIIYQCVEC